MAYNNYYPATYQPMYQPPAYQMPQSQGIQWVQGEVGARAYPVAPGSSVLLMDADSDSFFIKSADSSGMPTMKRYGYTEVVATQKSQDNRPELDMSQFVTREEFEEWKDSLKSKRGDK